MPTDELKRSDLVILERVPGFGYELHTSLLRVTASGWACYSSKRYITTEQGDREERREQREHRFSALALRRVRLLLEGLPPQPPPRVRMDDASLWVFRFWSGDEARVLRLDDALFHEESYAHWEEFLGHPYPAMQRVRALWRILHFPFARRRTAAAP